MRGVVVLLWSVLLTTFSSGCMLNELGPDHAARGKELIYQSEYIGPITTDLEKAPKQERDHLTYERVHVGIQP